MADHAGKAAGERAARSFAAIALLPTLLAAQEACPVRVSWQGPPMIGAAVTAVVADGRTLVMFGETFFTMRADSSGAPVPVDTSFAGMRRTPEGTHELIPRPEGARAFISPRAARVAADAIAVIWSEPDFDAGARYGEGAWLLRIATLRGRSWTAARTVARFTDHVALSRQMGSDVVRSGDTRRMAFTFDDTVTYTRPLVLVTQDASGWSLRRARLPLASAGSVALSDQQGRLVALVTAVSVPLNAPADIPVRQTIWRTLLADSGWAAPELVAGDGAEPRSDPQLLTTERGVIAAWLHRGEATNVLEWRDISREGAFGPIQRLDGVGMIVSGLEGHRDLLSVSFPDGTGRVLRLRADGFDDVGRYPSRSGFAFPAGGTRDSPIVVVTDIEMRDGHEWPTLTAYHLRCDRPPSGGAAPQR